jgi:predicted kinase
MSSPSLAKDISKSQSATVFSIDEWMSGLYLPDMPQPIDLSWVMSRVTRCHQRIWQTAQSIVSNGGSAVLDIGMPTANDRTSVRAMTDTHRLPSTWYFVTAPLPIRRERVMQRNTSKGATFSFEVTPQMFDFMDARFEEPTAAEMSLCKVIDTSLTV